MTAGRVLFSLREAAKMLRLRRDLVAEMAKDGRIRIVDVAGRRRVPLVEIERVQREGIPDANVPKPRHRRRSPEIPVDPAGDIRAIKI